MASEQAKSEQSLSYYENEINNFIIRMDATQRDLNRSPANSTGAVEEIEKNTGSKDMFIIGPLSKHYNFTQSSAAKDKSKKFD